MVAPFGLVFVMQTMVIILLGLAILAHARSRSAKRVQPRQFHQFKGWQKLLGWVAIACALLIVLNPDFLALGILGDSTFFDLLVVGLTLQMHEFPGRIFSRSWPVLVRGWRWLRIPSPGLRFLLMMLTFVLSQASGLLQKVWHRLSS
jgi:hypothetical protein